MSPRDDLRYNSPPKTIAVIGSGISGLSAAWLLSSRHHVTLYEKNKTLGGHTNTVTVPTNDGPQSVDTGFIVYNDATYPNFKALLHYIGIKNEVSEMSFAVSLDGGGYEYSGGTLRGLIAQKSNIIRPRFWGMVVDVLRFYRQAASETLTAEKAEDPQATLGDYLSQNGYNKAFSRDHLLPMTAAIWSTPETEIDQIPLKAFLKFFKNHGLLQLTKRPQWRTVSGGAKNYIAPLTRSINCIHTDCGDIHVLRDKIGVVIIDQNGARKRFNDIVIATHANDALKILADITHEEYATLSKFDYTENHAVLHSDQSLMPKRRTAWSSWNVLGSQINPHNVLNRKSAETLCVSYWMNKLQNLSAEQDFFITLNPGRTIDEKLVHYETTYSHPVFSTKTLLAQKLLWRLQGRANTWFCGAHLGYGFHEDGLQSGLYVAEQIGDVTRPWHVKEENSRILPLYSTTALEKYRQPA